MQLEEGLVRTGRHSTAYVACGPEQGTPIIFVHGWPERALSWRHVLPAMAERGMRAVAPDLRGYGDSSRYTSLSAYAQEAVVGDMLELADALAIERAVWVGHDWGTPTVWSIARHHAERCLGVAGLCVPYFTLERGLDAVIEQVDRSVYPQAQFPAGQWEYMRFYEESFAEATALFDSDPLGVVRALFRKGSADGLGQPSPTAYVRTQGGWFGGAGVVPEVPRDDDVISEAELAHYADGLTRNGFFGPDAYYMNHQANAHYNRPQAMGGPPETLHMPVLFLHGRFDYTCETVQSSLAVPMRERCPDLTEHVIDCGHWMAQEKPAEVTMHLADWVLGRL